MELIIKCVFLIVRIYKDEVGHVTVCYKKTSTEEDWHPKADEKPLEIFKLKDGLQPGLPGMINPRMDEDKPQKVCLLI